MKGIPIGFECWQSIDLRGCCVQQGSRHEETYYIDPRDVGFLCYKESIEYVGVD